MCWAFLGSTIQLSSHNPPGKAGGRSREAMSEENKALARRWADIFNEGNLELADEIYAPDYVDHDPTMPEDVRGVEGPENSTACIPVPSPTPK
jgi:SnoaL-like protein